MSQEVWMILVPVGMAVISWGAFVSSKISSIATSLKVLPQIEARLVAHEEHIYRLRERTAILENNQDGRNCGS